MAGYLLTRTVKACDILKVLQADGKPRKRNPLNMRDSQARANPCIARIFSRNAQISGSNPLVVSFHVKICRLVVNFFGFVHPEYIAILLRRLLAKFR